MDDLPDLLIDASFKGFPPGHAPLARSRIGVQGWRVAAGDLSYPVAVLRRSALEHNIAWMQAYAEGQGVHFAPHGKTTMSIELFRRQLDAGAWGLTVANVTQMLAALAAGARHVLIANQVLAAPDLGAIVAARRAHPGLRVLFLLDSVAQLERIEAAAPAARLEVLIEVGVPGGRTGCRSVDEGLALARRARQGGAVALAGIECYEGLANTGDDDTDRAAADALMDRVGRLAQACAAEGLFAHDEVLLSAGGSGVFDLVVPRLRLALDRPVRGVLRSGCYVAHDDGHYQHLVQAAERRLGCPAGQGLRAALQVWALVQSRPEPGLAILGAGKRDLSHDLGLPRPRAVCPRDSEAVRPAPAGWVVERLNDQHAYLRLAPDDALEVGDRVVLGISHPCTTFDKWRWMPVVDDDGRVVDAITTRF